MRKKQNSDAPKKAEEKPLKTDSEKKESARTKKTSDERGSELNDPLYDVKVDERGVADVVSEKAIEEIDYPPELAEFLGEVVQGLREQLGLGENEDFPEGYLENVFENAFSQVDIERLIHELKSEKIFGIESDDSDDSTSIENKAEGNESDEEFLTDEMLANLDYSKLEVNERGQRVFADFTLSCPVKPTGIIHQMLPVKIDEEAIKYNVVAHAIIPIIDMFPMSDIKEGSEHYEKEGYFLMDGKFVYEIHEETFQELQELLGAIGVVEGMTVAKEGEDTVAKVREYFENGGVVEGDFEPREDGYYEDLCEYWYDGKIYHEMDVIWLEIPRIVNMMGTIKGFSANMDSFVPIYSSCDITNAKDITIENGRRVPSNEEKFEIYYYGQNKEIYERLTPAEDIWYLATEYAKTKDTPGYCVVCRNGKFNVPVESFLNFETGESEELITIFNVANCYPIHHACVGLIIADVGNMQIRTAVRYCRGRTFDWAKRINQEMRAYRLQNPGFDPYDDPYDDPYNAV